MANHIKNILDTLLNKEANWQAFLISNWQTIIGNLKNHVCLERVYEDTIILGVNNSSWMHELYMLSDMLKQKINSHFKKPHIQKIRFKLINKKEFHSTLSKSISGKSYQNNGLKTIPTEKIKLNFQQERALDKIKDKELSEFLKIYLQKCNECKNQK